MLFVSYYALSISWLKCVEGIVRDWGIQVFEKVSKAYI